MRIRKKFYANLKIGRESGYHASYIKKKGA